jgi:hypothetical protein
MVQDRDADPVTAEGGAVTVILKGDMDATAPPSLALMVMSPVVPTLLLAGVPEIAPLLGLKLAQLGNPLTEKLAVPVVVEAVGWNL